MLTAGCGFGCESGGNTGALQRRTDVSGMFGEFGDDDRGGDLDGWGGGCADS